MFFFSFGDPMEIYQFKLNQVKSFQTYRALDVKEVDV